MRKIKLFIYSSVLLIILSLSINLFLLRNIRNDSHNSLETNYENIFLNFGGNITYTTINELLSDPWRFDGVKIFITGKVVNLNNQRVLTCLACFQLDGKLAVETIYRVSKYSNVTKDYSEELLGIEEGEEVAVVGVFDAKYKFLKAEDIIELEPEYPVCELKSINVNEAYVRRIAGIFNISNPKIEYTEGLYIVKSSYPRYLQVYEASGAFLYTDFSKIGNSSYNVEKVPLGQEREVYAKVMKFLKTHGLVIDRYPNYLKFKYNQIVTYSNETKAEIVINNGVEVPFKFRGPGDWWIEGPGAKIIVTLGRKYEIIGLYWAWRPIGECHYYRGISELEARRKIIELYNIPERAQLKIWLAYWAEPPYIEQKKLQPYYLFTYKVMVEGKPLQRMIGKILAVTSSELVMSSECSELTQTLISVMPIAILLTIIIGFIFYIVKKEVKLMRKILTVLFSIMLLMMIITHAAKAQSNDDTLNTEVGIEWVNSYPPSKGALLWRDDSARGFKDQLVTYLFWTARFDWGDNSSFEEDFKYRYAPGGGTDFLWIDAVDFAYFAGHGTIDRYNYGYIFFSNSEHDFQWFRSDIARWGGYMGGESYEEADLEWIVLDACLTLLHNSTHSVFERWGNAFRGLHYILGFGSIAYDYPPVGYSYGFYLRIGHTIENAWYIATMENQPVGVIGAVLSAYSESANPIYDRISPYEVSPDPYPWTYLRYFYWYC